MFEITKEQEALLRLPDPSTFFPLLCREIREEYSGKVGHLSDAALMDDVVKSHDHAACGPSPQRTCGCAAQRTRIWQRRI